MALRTAAKIEDDALTPAFIRNQRARQAQAQALREGLAPPTTVQSGSLRPVPRLSGGGGGGDGGAGAAAAAAAAAEAKAKKAGKDQTARENQATQQIIDALLGSVKGFEQGRDTQISNANSALQSQLAGILQNYTGAVDDYQKTAVVNDEDQAGKSAANVQNRARERLSLLLQTASQGGGETDQLRAQLQAFQNADANQLEIDRAYQDTSRSIASQVAGANSQMASQRQSAWAQNQEAIGSAMNDFYKNWTDTFTNIQRTAAQNSNIDSDYSTGFSADLKGYDPVAEASRWAGRTYATQEKDEEFFNEGRRTIRQNKPSSGERAATTTIGAPRAAEGATLRGRG